MAAAPFPPDALDPLAVLRSACRRGAAAPGCDALAACAAQLCGCPVAALSLVDRDGEWVQGAHGLDLRELPREHSPCAHAVSEGRGVVVGDAAADPRFAHGPLVAGAPRLRFFAVEPVRVGAHALAGLWVADRVVRGLGPAQRSGLQAAAEAAGELLRCRAAEQLLDAERRRARDGEALLAKLSAQLPGAVHQYRIDADGRESLPYTSSGMHEFLGIDGRRLAEQPELFFERVPADDRAALRASIEQSRRTLGLWRHEFRLRRADGTLRWMLSSAMPELEPDGATIWHGFTADVTALKQTEIALRRSEARWSMAAAAAGIGVAELDVATGALRLDAQAWRNHGIAHAHERLTIDDWFAMLVVEDRAAAAAALERALDEGALMEGRYRLRWPDGSVHTLEVVARAQEGDDGPRTVIGTCRDVTAQQEAEHWRRDKETAERASLAKSEFLSRVSHELRTPLNGILGFMQLMAMDRQHALAPGQRRRLEGATRSARHLLALIDGVLDLTRIERDDFSLPLRPVDVQRAAAAALDAVQPLAQAHGVRLPAPPAGAGWACANVRALEQVLMNLLSNAIRYNRRGGAVRLEAGADTRRTRLAVVDEGPGLSEAQQRELFQPFNRLGAERTHREGSGLGLVIARHLVRAMRGELRVESRVGSGSRFTVELDAAAPADGESSLPALLDTAPAPLAAAGAPPRRVLYVEDEPLNVVLMQEVFRPHPNWTLEVARDGAQGLAMARRNPPDLVLVDMNLPDMSGVSVVEALRKDPATASLRCIALSADVMHGQVDAARRAGFDDYWTKPIDVRGIVAALERVLGR